MASIKQGDCLELMKEIPDKSIDMILCDLPYGTTACKWDSVIPFEPLWEQYNRIIKDNGAIVLFGSEPFSTVLRMSNLKNYKYDWIWCKTKPSGFLNCKKQPMRKQENISVFYKKQCIYNPQDLILKDKQNKNSCKENTYGKVREFTQEVTYTNYPHNVLEYANIVGSNCLHPTQKPVALLEYLIKTYTNEGETVLDNCMGSGSTGVACINTNRDFIGYELNEEYFNIAQNRLREAWKEKHKNKAT